MDRIADRSPATSVELHRLRAQVDRLERRLARLEARDGYGGSSRTAGQRSDESACRVREMVREQSAILMLSSIVTAIVVFLIVTAAT